MEYSEGTSYKGLVRAEGDQQGLGKQGAVCILRHDVTRGKRGFPEIAITLGEGHLIRVVVLEEQHH